MFSSVSILNENPSHAKFALLVQSVIAKFKLLFVVAFTIFSSQDSWQKLRNLEMSLPCLFIALLVMLHTLIKSSQYRFAWQNYIDSHY